MPALAFRFSLLADQTVLELQAHGVRSLRIVQPDDWEEGEADQIEHLVHRSSGHALKFACHAGGCTHDFHADRLTCRLFRIL